MAIMLLPIYAFAFEWGDVLKPEFWVPYAAILLAISEWLAMTDMVKANGILALIVDLIKKFAAGLQEK
jgi:hypothetical protein